MTSLVFFLYTFAGAFSQVPFTIEASTPSVLNDKMIYLVVQDTYSTKRKRIIDSTVVKNNHFTFRGLLDKPAEMAHIVTKDKSDRASFVVEGGLNKMIVGEVAKTSRFFKNKLSNTVILNSRANLELKQIDSLELAYILTRGKPSHSNKNILELDTAASVEMRSREFQIIRSYPDCYYSLIRLYCLSFESYSDSNEIRKVFNELNADIKNSELGKELQFKFEAKSAAYIGKKINPFSIMTDKSTLFSSATLNGKPYMIAFSATWCKPCKEKIPFLLKLYEKYRSQGFEIVYVNLDDNEKLWKQQIAAYKMGWINVSEGKKRFAGKLSRDLNVTAIPFYLIVDKSGTIIYNPFQLKDYEYEKIEMYILKSLGE